MHRGDRRDRNNHISAVSAAPRFRRSRAPRRCSAPGCTPVTLGPKEGLALINGTQPSTAVLALALAGAEQLARAADIAAALSIDALRGSMHPFEARIHDAAAVRRPGGVGRQHRAR